MTGAVRDLAGHRHLDVGLGDRAVVVAVAQQRRRRVGSELREDRSPGSRCGRAGVVGRVDRWSSSSSTGSMTSVRTVSSTLAPSAGRRRAAGWFCRARVVSDFSSRSTKRGQAVDEEAELDVARLEVVEDVLAVEGPAAGASRSGAVNVMSPERVAVDGDRDRGAGVGGGRAVRAWPARSRGSAVGGRVGVDRLEPGDEAVVDVDPLRARPGRRSRSVARSGRRGGPRPGRRSCRTGPRPGRGRR